MPLPPGTGDEAVAEGCRAETGATHGSAGSAWLPLLALDRLLFHGQEMHTIQELAGASGVDMEVAGKLWKAMGFTPVADDEPAFLDDDLDALRLAAKAIADSSNTQEVIYQTRVMAASLSRVAEVVSDNIVANHPRDVA